MKCGNLPVDLGLIDIHPNEMMFWMYCPIKFAQCHNTQIPDNLRQYSSIINEVYRDIKKTGTWVHEFDNDWYNSYVYVTAKTLWVSSDYIGNRPGWHSDGFGTDDINYIWHDRAPTEFICGDFEVSDECMQSMIEMESIAVDWCYQDYLVYQNKHLLKLDPSVIHRSPVGFEAGMRTFVKVSVSKHKYNLEGNSINHKLGPIGVMKPRDIERNHPSK